MNPILESLFPDDDVVARSRAQGFPPLDPAPDQYTAYLHMEMWLCFLNGLDHAAVVMSCALVDFAVKNALYFKAYVDAGCKFDPVQWDNVDGLEFGKVIGMAKTQGVVTKEQWQQLDWIREHVRNEYMHGATPEWLKDKEMAGVKVGNLETGEITERTVKLREDLSLQREGRIRADRIVCKRVIPLVDDLVRMLARGIVQRLDDWRAKNPSTATKAQVDRVLDNMHKQGIQVDQIVMRDIPREMMTPVSQGEMPRASTGQPDRQMQLRELIEFAQAGRRVCPQPPQWSRLWEMLPGRTRTGMGWSPPPPLILAAWSQTSDSAKRERLQEHLRYAEQRGVLGQVDVFLRALTEGDWYHENNEMPSSRAPWGGAP